MPRECKLSSGVGDPNNRSNFCNTEPFSWGQVLTNTRNRVVATECMTPFHDFRNFRAQTQVSGSVSQFRDFEYWGGGFFFGKLQQHHMQNGCIAKRQQDFEESTNVNTPSPKKKGIGEHVRDSTPRILQNMFKLHTNLWLSSQTSTLSQRKGRAPQPSIT